MTSDTIDEGCAVKTVPSAPTANGADLPITDKRGFAARWQFSTRQVDNFLAQGMPHFKIGKRRVRIAIAEADAWMRERFSQRRISRISMKDFLIALYWLPTEIFWRCAARRARLQTEIQNQETKNERP